MTATLFETALGVYKRTWSAERRHDAGARVCSLGNSGQRRFQSFNQHLRAAVRRRCAKGLW